MVVVVQLVRTSDCGSEGRGFKSHHPPHFKSLEVIHGFFCLMKWYYEFSDELLI